MTMFVEIFLIIIAILLYMALGNIEKRMRDVVDEMLDIAERMRKIGRE